MGVKFKNGNTAASVQKGTKKKKTIIKETLGLDNLEALKPDVIRVWRECIQSANESTRITAAKEISKYLFAQKRTVEADINANVKAEVTNLTDEELEKIVNE